MHIFNSNKRGFFVFVFQQFETQGKEGGGKGSEGKEGGGKRGEREGRGREGRGDGWKGGRKIYRSYRRINNLMHF